MKYTPYAFAGILVVLMAIILVDFVPKKDSSNQFVVPVIKTKVVNNSAAIFTQSEAPEPVHYNQTERRVVQLPVGNPKSSLDTAERVCRVIIDNGFVADIEQRFPRLTREQLAGLFLNSSEQDSPSGKIVLIATGISYRASFPQAREVADYCELAVQRGLIQKVPVSVTPSVEAGK